MKSSLFQYLFKMLLHLSSQALTQSTTPSDTDGWNLTSVHGTVLEEIKNCLMDATSVYSAASATSATVNRLPRGVDKLIAARSLFYTNSALDLNLRSGLWTLNGITCFSLTRFSLIVFPLLHFSLTVHRVRDFS
jgi:hypothetical protein